MIQFMVAAMLQAAAGRAPAPSVPFNVGESFEYAGRWKVFTVGDAVLSVAGVDMVAGIPTWHFKLVMQVGIPLYKNHSELESWTGVNDFVSRRFVHTVIENGKQLANDDFHIHADSGFFRNHSDTVTHATPRLPLDDLAFIYYLRTMELKTGGVYSLSRYFRNDHNPVTVTVIGHDSVEMPDGNRCYCWVLHPVVDEPNGLFSRMQTRASGSPTTVAGFPFRFART